MIKQIRRVAIYKKKINQKLNYNDDVIILRKKCEWKTKECTRFDVNKFNVDMKWVELGQVLKANFFDFGGERICIEWILGGLLC